MEHRQLIVWTSDQLLLNELDLAPLEIRDVRSFAWDFTSFHRYLLQHHKTELSPDVVVIGSTWVSRLASEGVLLDISQLATNDLHASHTFFPRLLHSCRDLQQPATYYAVPVLADVQILFYNSELVGPGLMRFPDAFSQWDTFERMCAALQPELQVPVIAWPLGPDALIYSLPWIWAAGGDILGPNGALLLDSERTQLALLRLARLILLGCAPLPPDHAFHTATEVRNQFARKRVAIAPGTLWMLGDAEVQKISQATIYPPDMYPATFVGSSNLALVAKFGADAQSPEYNAAKLFLRRMLESSNQLQFARTAGKLPATLTAWSEMRARASDPWEREILGVFDRAISHTVDRGMPNLPNLVQIEELLMQCLQEIWQTVGDTRRTSPDASIEVLEKKSAQVITTILTRYRKEVEPLAAGRTVRYHSQRVQEIGIQPPGTFDIWLKYRLDEPGGRGEVITTSGAIAQGIGSKQFQVLLALANAPRRMLTIDEILDRLWKNRDGTGTRRSGQVIDIIANLECLTNFENTLATSDLLAIAERLYTERRLQEFAETYLLNRQWNSSRTLDQLRVDVARYLQDIVTELKEATDFDQHRRNADSLRQAIKALNKQLASLPKSPVITRFSIDEHHGYALDPALAICVEIA